MVIIGIDPGSRLCGYGMLQTEGKRVMAAGCDVIDVSTTKDLMRRLVMLYDGIDAVLQEYKPDVAAVESMFIQKHIRSIFTLGHARGVIMLAIARHGIPMVEYSPREIKKAVVGNGNAAKQQVRYMVNQMFKLSHSVKPDDAYDALAMAVCHFNRMKFQK